MPRPRHSHDERGAILPATVVIIGVCLMIASLVIDVGGDRIVRRDMQALADVVALDVVRRLDGSAAGAYAGYNATGPSAALLATVKQESLARQSAIVDPSAVTVRLAVVNKDSGEFVRWAGPSDIPNAVKVWTTGGTAFRLLPTTPRSTNIQRSALAMIGPPIACISAGATFADVNLNQQGPLDTMLGKLLGGRVGVDRLSVLDSYALATLDMEIPLADLAAEMNVGSVEEILTAEISAHDFVLAISEVLPPQNGNNPSPKALLDAIVNGLPDTPGFKPGDILSLDTGGGSATTIVINTFALVQAVIMVSNMEHFVYVKQNVSLPGGLTHADVQAKVVEAPKIGCGPIGTVARSAQIQLKLTADVSAGTDTSIDPLYINVAEGTGTITDVKCTPGNRSVTVSATSAAGTYGLRLLTETKVTLVLLPVDVDLEVLVPNPADYPDGAAIGTPQSESYTFEFPDDEIPAGRTFGTQFGSLGLSSASSIDVNPSPDLSASILNGLLGTTVRPLLGVVDPIVSNALRPILANLGVSVGTVRIQPVGAPSCNEPFLRD